MGNWLVRGSSVAPLKLNPLLGDQDYIRPSSVRRPCMHDTCLVSAV